jgi:D-cysteine desulfhydrase
MGGTNALGSVAYVNAAFELAGQGPLPDVVYVAAGTVGTAVGLAVGFAALGASTRVEAVRVTPGEVCSEHIAHELARATVELLRGVAPDFPDLGADELPFTMRDEYFAPGYGVATPETLAAVDSARAAGVTLETTYTGKAFTALLDDACAGRTRDLDVVFWNTYNSAPVPAAGPDDALPDVLRGYVSDCDRLFGEKEM